MRTINNKTVSFVSLICIPEESFRGQRVYGKFKMAVQANDKEDCESNEKERNRRNYIWLNNFACSVLFRLFRNLLSRFRADRDLDRYLRSIEFCQCEPLEPLVITGLLISQDTDCNSFAELEGFGGIRSPMDSGDVATDSYV